MSTDEVDLTYGEAKRQARYLLGQHADVVKSEGQPFPARVGVWMGSRFILVGAGLTWTTALDDARTRQRLLEG